MATPNISLPTAASVNAVLTSAVYATVHGLSTGGTAAENTAAIKAAIAATPTGGRLIIDAGTYVVEEDGATGACAHIVKSMHLDMQPGTVLKLDPDADVPILMIGDNSTAFSHVTITGGELDGDSTNSNITPAVRTSLLEVRGPVTDVFVSDVTIGNALLGGVEVAGTDTNNRAERVFFDRCPVDTVTEGVVIEFCDNFHWRGGDISNMSMQDCFEPHGGIDNWSLRDCTISAADPTNSEIEIFPQVGDILNGVIENVIIKGEVRISVSSAATYEVNSVLIGAGTVFENGLLYTGAGTGVCKNIVVDGARFIGPASNVPRNVPTTYNSAIHTYGAANSVDVLNCEVYGYEGTGIVLSNDNAKIIGNRVYNNATEATLAGYLCCGIQASGDGVLVMGNHVFDTQGTVTQDYTPQITGDNVRVIGNLFENAATLTRNLGTGWVSEGNAGDFEDVVLISATITASSSYVDVPASMWPQGSYSMGSDMSVFHRTTVAPSGDMTPATYVKLVRTSDVMRIQTDAAVTADTIFVVRIDFTRAFATV